MDVVNEMDKMNVNKVDVNKVGELNEMGEEDKVVEWVK